MQINYTVHSATSTPVDVQASFNGQTITATVDGYVVELVSEGGAMSHTLKAMPGADKDFLAANFAVGASVVGVFSLASTSAPA